MAPGLAPLSGALAADAAGTPAPPLLAGDPEEEEEEEEDPENPHDVAITADARPATTTRSPRRAPRVVRAWPAIGRPAALVGCLSWARRSIVLILRWGRRARVVRRSRRSPLPASIDARASGPRPGPRRHARVPSRVSDVARCGRPRLGTPAPVPAPRVHDPPAGPRPTCSPIRAPSLLIVPTSPRPGDVAGVGRSARGLASTRV